MQLQQVQSALHVGYELRSDGGFQSPAAASCSSGQARSIEKSLRYGGFVPQSASSRQNLPFLQGDRARKIQKASRSGGFMLQSASSCHNLAFLQGDRARKTQKSFRHGEFVLQLASSSRGFDRARKTLRSGGFLLKSPAAAKNLSFFRKCAVIRARASDEAENGENVKKKKPKSENEQLPVVVAVAEKLRPDHVYVREGAVSPITVEEIQKGKQTTHRQQSPLETEAWSLLRGAMVYYCGSPCGTIAANDPSDSHPLNYDQVFIRDFIPSAIAFLLKGEPDIVRNFLLHTLQLQSWEKTVDCYNPGQGLMPASFKVRTVPLEGEHANATEEVLDPDFGEAAIGRVAPVDSGLWWIILLRAYGKSTGDYSLQERVDVQTGMKMILKLCLADGFDMFPTLLVTDGSCMIDRRMGIHGHPLEIQALFYSALRCAREMLIPEDSQDLIRAITSRLSALSFHIREYYWVDMRKLNEIYRYKTEEYSHDAVNKFNIYPDHLSPWLVDWIPNTGGYLVGNLQPAHMDFRFFSLGNLWAIVGSLATPEQAEGILDLIEARWTDFVGNMPLKICYPALTGEEWRIITGSDPKNTPWSYHNGGSWPTLLWQLTVACIKMGRPEMAQRAIEVAEKRISRDRWPEYYDTRAARFVGKQARLYQTWTVAGYLTAKMLLDNPEAVKMLTCEEDLALLEAMSCSLDTKKRTRKWKSTRIIV